MHHIIFEQNTKYKVAILIKPSAFIKDELLKNYVSKVSILNKDIIAFTLKYNENNKAPAAMAKEYLKHLLKSLDNLGTEVLFTCDSNYFKYLTGVRKVTGSLGYVKGCTVKGYEHMKVILCPNYQSIFYNPRAEDDIKLALKTLDTQVTGFHVDIGNNIIHNAEYPKTYDEIKQALDRLHQYDELSCDIETLSLKFYKTSIATIAFAPDKHNGTCFLVDYKENKTLVDPTIPDNYYYGEYFDNPKVRKLLLDFFLSYKGKLIYHNGSFDMKIIINALFMKDLLDTKGMLHGIDVLTRNFDDTKLITYLATNSTAGNKLSLKYQAHEFAGDYGQEDDEINNIRLIPIKELKEYNLKDCLATNFTKEKHWNTVINDNQLKVYEIIFKPSVRTILQMELTGAPIDMGKVYEVKKELEDIQEHALSHILPSKHVIATKSKLEFDFLSKDFNDRKAKAKFPENIKPKKIEDIDIPFNINSVKQLGELLYGTLNLPIIDTTEKGAPSTGAKTLKKLVNHVTEPRIKDLINHIITYAQSAKITSTFIKAFIENSVLKPDGVYYLHGNYNLGGTVSGRLSCVAAHTPIVTKKGIKPIIDIKLGDLVWTHKERWMPITDTIYKGIDDMYNVHLCNGEVLTCTKDHKLLTLDNQWLTLEELVNVSIKNMDTEQRKYRKSSAAISKYNSMYDNARHSKRIRNYISKCIRSFKKASHQRRIISNKKSKIFCFQNRQQESNERKNKRTASQLGRRVSRRLRLFNSNFSRKKAICAQSSHDGVFRNKRIAQKYRCTSYRQQSFKQRVRQLSSLYKNCSPTYSLLTGRGQQRIEIKKIEYSGRSKVYDISVAKDASYLSCGLYSHNSSGPNMQNIPSGSKYAKLIKKCFIAPPGWLLAGADFDSLEDKVSALTTKDPNKLKVYEDGYCGHCLRAYFYFKDQMPDIVNTVESINSIKYKYPKLRQKSKAPTFLLTYGGKYYGLMSNLGIEQSEAMAIESNYHELYTVSDDWVTNRLMQASKVGYTDVAFGLRVRTPILEKTVLGTKGTPYKAEKEGRTAGNAMGQSYGMLNNRAGIEFQKRVLESPYKYDIKPIMQIHDAMYFIIRDDIDVIKWFNDNLPDCMAWQKLSELYHPTVKLSGAVDIFYPNWSNEIGLPNNASKQEIWDICQKNK